MNSNMMILQKDNLNSINFFGFFLLQNEITLNLNLINNNLINQKMANRWQLINCDQINVDNFIWKAIGVVWNYFIIENMLKLMHYFNWFMIIKSIFAHNLMQCYFWLKWCCSQKNFALNQFKTWSNYFSKFSILLIVWFFQKMKKPQHDPLISFILSY